MRVAYRGALLGLAARDLRGDVDVADVAAELADLAAATLEARWPWPGPSSGRPRRPAGSRSSRWASAVAASSTTSATSTSCSWRSRVEGAAEEPALQRGRRAGRRR